VRDGAVCASVWLCVAFAFALLVAAVLLGGLDDAVAGWADAG
jgi:hypothetical protein